MTDLDIDALRRRTQMDELKSSRKDCEIPLSTRPDEEGVIEHVESRPP